MKGTKSGGLKETPQNDEGIKTSEWLNALNEAFAESEEGFTTDELSQRLGCSVRTARNIVRRLKMMGKIVVGRSYRLCIDNVSKPFPVYRLVESPKKVKKAKKARKV